MRIVIVPSCVAGSVALVGFMDGSYELAARKSSTELLKVRPAIRLHRG
jgi:hypothetical protein